jgi:hypothetical protein
VGDGTPAHSASITLNAPNLLPYQVLAMPLSGNSTAPFVATVSSDTGGQFYLGSTTQGTQYTYSGIVQLFPTQVTLTKAFGALTFDNMNIFINFMASFQAQLYHYKVVGGGASFASVPGTTCQFSPTGGGGPLYQYVLPGFSNACSNTSFSETFLPGEGGFWVVSATVSVPPGQQLFSTLPTPIVQMDVSMSTSE